MTGRKAHAHPRLASAAKPPRNGLVKARALPEPGRAVTAYR